MLDAIRFPSLTRNCLVSAISLRRVLRPLPLSVAWFGASLVGGVARREASRVAAGAQLRTKVRSRGLSLQTCMGCRPVGKRCTEKGGGFPSSSSGVFIVQILTNLKVCSSRTALVLVSFHCSSKHNEHH